MVTEATYHIIWQAKYTLFGVCIMFHTLTFLSLDILKQRTTDVDIKKYFVDYLEQVLFILYDLLTFSG